MAGMADIPTSPIEDALTNLYISGVTVKPHPTEPGFYVADAKEVWELFGRMARVGRYPWFAWENGATWIVYRGKDYTTGPESFAAVLYKRAALRGLKVAVTLNVKPGALSFRFYKPEQAAK